MRRTSAIRIVLVVLGLGFGSLLGTGTASAAGEQPVEIGDALVIERTPAPRTHPRPAPCGRRFTTTVKLRCTPKVSVSR